MSEKTDEKQPTGLRPDRYLKHTSNMLHLSNTIQLVRASGALPEGNGQQKRVIPYIMFLFLYVISLW